MQPIDVRDLARFLVRAVEQGTVGVFNVAPPPRAATFGDLLRACVAAVSQDAERPVELIWADEDWLVGQGVTQWTELPLWRNAVAPWAMNTDRAGAAGLQCRPLTETVADTRAWLRADSRPVMHERFTEHGMEPDREAMLIRRWLAAHPH